MDTDEPARVEPAAFPAVLAPRAAA
jgi:hypothetical protein